MLKIKDDIDLKELEKFKFKFRDYSGRYEYYNKSYVVIYINSWNREIFIKYMQDTLEQYMHPLEDVIYDLIQAGLVDKVNGE